MMDSAKAEAAPAPETVTAYITDMLGQLAQMADASGQARWADNIRLAAIPAGAEGEGGHIERPKAGR